MKAGYKIVESRIPDQRELIEDLAEGRAYSGGKGRCQNDPIESGFRNKLPDQERNRTDHYRLHVNRCSIFNLTQLYAFVLCSHVLAFSFYLYYRN